MKKLILILSSTVLFSNSITIYNNNLAHLQEKREFNLTKGIQKLEFKNLPNSVIVDSLSADFNSNSVELISQNYTYNPLSIKMLLEANLNTKVDFFTLDKKSLKSGKLISTTPTIVESDGKYYTVNQNSIVFSNFPKNIDLKPKLEWELNSKEALKASVDLSYLINSINWTSNYTLNLKEKKLSLKAWAKVKNSCGKDFKDIKLYLVAGDTNRVNRTRSRPLMYAKADMVESAVVAPKKLSGYYLYKIPYIVNIANNQSKQFALIDAKDVKFKQYGVVHNRNFGNYGEQKLAFSQVIEFKNSKKNNLGLPLPQGVVRVYKDNHYLGEDRVKNSAVNEKIKLNIGTLFDIIGSKKITKYIRKEKYGDIETTYTIKNRGNETIEVEIKESIPHYGNKITHKTDCKDECSYKKENAFNRVYKILLKPKEVFKFKSEYEVFSN